MENTGRFEIKMGREWTEKIHAKIVMVYYEMLEKYESSRGIEAFSLLVQEYGYERGLRMAQRAIHDGKPLDYTSYVMYGEFQPSAYLQSTGEGNESTSAQEGDDVVIRITRCPWASVFEENKACGKAYCTNIDRSIMRGFHPKMEFDLKQTLNERDCCIQVVKNEKLPVHVTGQYKKDFSYHCAHVYWTFRHMTHAIFLEDSRVLLQDVDKEIQSFLSLEQWELLQSYETEDFRIRRD